MFLGDAEVKSGPVVDPCALLQPEGEKQVESVSGQVMFLKTVYNHNNPQGKNNLISKAKV